MTREDYPQARDVGMVIILIAGIFAICAWASSAQCANQATKMGFPYSWKPFQGCMISPSPGKWVPLRNYRVL